MSADGADWIHPAVRAKAPQAQICLDAFHVVKWAVEKLDELRRRIAGELRAAGRAGEAATLGSGMWALRKDRDGHEVCQVLGCACPCATLGGVDTGNQGKGPAGSGQ